MIKKNILIASSLVLAASLFGFINLQEDRTSSTAPQQIQKILTTGEDRISTDRPVNPPVDESNSIQVALLLDTSSSMNGLIEQAKSQLWNILNVLARTEKGANDTNLEIALYEYGNPGAATARHQINQLTQFTSDVDLISEKLFALSTDGGEEYCGAIIKTSIDDLNWTNADALKLIYIAGNESFNQGPIDGIKSCKKAKEQDIFVNTIFCGTGSASNSWESGAQVAGGEFFNINPNKETVYIETPYDDQIESLNQQLNLTYIPIGREGNSKIQSQISEDNNASKYGKSNIADRASYKSSKKYKAESWDLVDAYKKDKSNAAKNQSKLDQKYQEMSIEELEAEIEQVAQERSTIQDEIQRLDKLRREFIAKEKEKSTEDNSLQNSIIKSIHKQAAKRGFTVTA